MKWITCPAKHLNQHFSKWFHGKLMLLIQRKGLWSIMLRKAFALDSSLCHRMPSSLWHTTVRCQSPRVTCNVQNSWQKQGMRSVSWGVSHSDTLLPRQEGAGRTGPGTATAHGCTEWTRLKHPPGLTQGSLKPSHAPQERRPSWAAGLAQEPGSGGGGLVWVSAGTNRSGATICRGIQNQLKTDI